jgi:hypothetical protein
MIGKYSARGTSPLAHRENCQFRRMRQRPSLAVVFGPKWSCFRCAIWSKTQLSTEGEPLSRR